MLTFIFQVPQRNSDGVAPSDSEGSIAHEYLLPTLGFILPIDCSDPLHF